MAAGPGQQQRQHTGGQSDFLLGRIWLGPAPFCGMVDILCQCYRQGPGDDFKSAGNLPGKGKEDKQPE